MQNLFVKENDEFTVEFTVATNDKGSIFCDINRESLLESVGELGEMEIKDYKAVFKKPSFGSTMEMFNDVFNINGSDGINLNPLRDRYNKISALIKRWDLTENEGKPSEEEIKSLHPVIATVIGILIDAEIGPILG